MNTPPDADPISLLDYLGTHASEIVQRWKVEPVIPLPKIKLHPRMVQGFIQPTYAPFFHRDFNAGDTLGVVLVNGHPGNTRGPTETLDPKHATGLLRRHFSQRVLEEIATQQGDREVTARFFGSTTQDPVQEIDDAEVIMRLVYDFPKKVPGASAFFADMDELAVPFSWHDRSNSGGLVSPFFLHRSGKTTDSSQAQALWRAYLRVDPGGLTLSFYPDEKGVHFFPFQTLAEAEPGHYTAQAKT